MADARENWVVEAVDLTAGYGDTLVLDHVTVRFREGHITCIVGGSGCGKSTLLRSLIGLLPPKAGDVRVLGQDLYALDEEERSSVLGSVGFMFQYGALLNSISVAENLAIPLRAHTDLSDDVIDEIVEMKLSLVNLAGAGRKLPGELSGGMRKRAGFARAMILDPPVILCDEPSAGLDPITMANLDELLLRFKSTATMIVVTHELSSILAIADYVVMLGGGGIVFDGPLEQALESEQPELKRFFGRQPETLEDRPRSLYDALSGAAGAQAAAS